MKPHRVVLPMMLVTMVATGGASLFGQSGVTTSTVDAVRRELLQLPYYTVFDFLAFKCEGATVTLMGYASTPMLGIDAERAVRRVAGVDAIEDKIELLPLSLDDDNLRWNLYYTIYRDPFLSRYAPGEGRLWGHTHTFPRDQLLAFGPIRFLGTEPAGDYPIHIIVSRGHVTLLGVVESDGDKRRAGVLAQGVSGSLEVENELTIDAPVRETDPRT